ncbi:methyltransferase, FxLD system [Actinosynnema sp. NPDC050436]|uniref:methyltransferase, FxLD system n=1 Tax=Actinosynnema sp. NPDC050436 TaxID=3155659 RepID=UPI0033C57640
MTDSTLSPDQAGDRARRAAVMRNEVVDALVAEGTIVSPQVEVAMRTVPREVFAPEGELEKVYDLGRGFVTKVGGDGTSLSSVSAPQVQAHMLEQADIWPGHRVLEIGSGGYNAALLAELVGPSGTVVTVDIDSDVVDRARRFLPEAGYPQVLVVLADAEHGVPGHAPYDRILVTVGAWDVPPAWTDQLAEDGLLLVPLSVRGLSRTLVFERDGDRGLVSRSSRMFGWVPMQGVGAHPGRQVVLRGGELTLNFDGEPAADFDAVAAALEGPRVEVWTGAAIAKGEPWSDAHLWLATHLPGYCRIVLDRTLDTGVVVPPGRMSAATGAVDGGTLAYVTYRPFDEHHVEWGVHAYGAGADRFAGEVADLLRVWTRDYRGGPGPRFGVHPAGTPDERLAGDSVVDKRHTRITISWPQAATAADGRATRQKPTE